ncbi:hypothetical protein GCM10027299_28720 [Larkinella ripae]
MKPVHLLFLNLLVWQCKPASRGPDPAAIPKQLKRITSGGITIDFQYATNKLSGLTMTSGEIVEQIEYTRHQDGQVATMATRLNNRETGTYRFERDDKNRVVKISIPHQTLYEYQYDAQGNLSTVTNTIYKVTEELSYSGNNLVAFGYKPSLQIPYPIQFKAVNWDEKPNPLYELNRQEGFIFPMLMDMSNSGLLHTYSPVLDKNNVLEEVYYDTGKVYMKYEYEYQDGWPVIRKTFQAGPGNNLMEVKFFRVTYEY